MNSVNLTGRITKEPELKTTQEGKNYVFFCLAVDGGKDKQGNKITDFIDCIAYTYSADFIGKYVHKGDLLEVNGRLHISERTDEAGNKSKRATVKADSVGICSSKAKQETATQPAAPNTPITTPDNAAISSELPFEL